jgi:hypothetical protein
MQFQSKILRIILILVGVVTILAVGIYARQLFFVPEVEVRESIWVPQKKYSSANYYFNYPRHYEVSATGEGKTYILTVYKNDSSKLEIFKADEYPGDRAAFGFTGMESSEEAEEYVEGVKKKSAKEYLTIGEGQGKYDVWLYYQEGDEETKNELKEIFNSIQIKQKKSTKKVPETDVSEVVVDMDESKWETYRNDEYGFEFKYPHNYPVNVYIVSIDDFDEDPEFGMSRGGVIDDKNEIDGLGVGNKECDLSVFTAHPIGIEYYCEIMEYDGVKGKFYRHFVGEDPAFDNKFVFYKNNSRIQLSYSIALGDLSGLTSGEGVVEKFNNYLKSVQDGTAPEADLMLHEAFEKVLDTLKLMK